MGVYIDMDMPEDSDMIVIYADGTARKYLSYTKVIIDEVKVIPVPQHGRLIDAREMFLPFVVKGQRSKRYHLGEKWELNGAEIREVIDSLPTIIPADIPTKEDTGIQKEFMQNWHEEGE